jgi:hypothetical protein
MLRKRRTVPLRRTLQLEALEQRTLMTGNVTVSLDFAGTLHILGDGGGVSSTFPEYVQVLDSSPPGLPNLTFRVQGKPGTFTSINGVQFIDFVGSSINSVTAAFPTFSSPTIFNGLDIIGMFPSAPTSGTSFPGQVTLSAAGSGATSLSISNITTNVVTLVDPTSTAGCTVTLNSVKAGLLTTTTGGGNDRYTITGANLAITNLNTGNGNDNVSIVGSTVGSLSSSSGATGGNVTYNITGNSMSKASIAIGTVGPTVGDDSVTFNGNVILNSAILNIGTGGVASPQTSGSTNLGGHFVNINGNTEALASGGILATIGSVIGRTNTSGSIWSTTRVTADTNKVAGTMSLNVGTWAYQVEANGNAVAGAMSSNVGNFSGVVSNNGGSNPVSPPAAPPFGINLSNDIVGGTLSLRAGDGSIGGVVPTGFAAGNGAMEGTTAALNMVTDQVGKLAVTTGDASNSITVPVQGQTLNSTPFIATIANIAVTAASSVANTINLAFDGSNPAFTLGGQLRASSITINNVQSPATPVLVNIGVPGPVPVPGSPPVPFVTTNLNGGTGTVVLNAITSNELDANVGNGFSNVALQNSTTTPDGASGGPFGPGNMNLTVGFANGSGEGITVQADSIGNGTTGQLGLVKLDSPTGGGTTGGFDVTTWNIANIKTFDWMMAAGDSFSVNSTQIATLTGITVNDFLLAQFTGGFSGVQATGVVVSPGFGILNGGGNSGSVFIGAPSNFGFVVLGFGAAF